jgi:hypothetical protein
LAFTELMSACTFKLTCRNFQANDTAGFYDTLPHGFEIFILKRQFVLKNRYTHEVLADIYMRLSLPIDTYNMAYK